MGVQGLWKLVEPCGRMVPLETLSNKVLAVDVSIWLHQAMKGMHDVQGAPVAVAHLLVLFHRLCKLLFYKIKPVFVFDGGVPLLKRQTMANRRIKKSTARTEATRVRSKLLKNLLKHEALRHVLADESATAALGLSSLTLPGPAEEEDLYKLPPIAEQPSASNTSDSSAPESEEEEEQPPLDMHSLDIEGPSFRALPAELRHDILSDLKDTRKQNSWRYLDQMPHKSQDFSDFQMSRLLKRRAVQVSLEECGKEMGARDVSLQELQGLLGDGFSSGSVLTGRVAQEDTTKFMLVQKPKGIELKTGNNPDVKKKEESFDITERLDDVMWSSDSESGTNHQLAIPKPDIDGHLKHNQFPLSQLLASSKTVDEITAVLEEGIQVKNESNLQNVILMETDRVLSTEVDQNCDSLMINGMRDNPDDVSLMSERSTPTKNTLQNMQVHAQLNVLVPEKATEEAVDEKLNKKDVLDILEVLQDDNMKRSPIEYPLKEEKEECIVKSISGEDCAHLSPLNENNSAAVEAEHTLNLHKEGFEKVIVAEEEANSLIMESIKSNVSMPDEQVEKIKPALERTSKGDQEMIDYLEGVATIPPASNCDKSNAEELAEVVNENTGSEINKENLADELSTDSDDEFIPVEDSPPMYPVSREKEAEDEPDTEDRTDVEPTRNTVLQEGMSSEEIKSMHTVLQMEHDQLISEQGRQERLAQTVTDQMYADAQELLRLFGVPFIVAPMEAEAQCAALDQLGLTEGTITDDSDIWLFGGRVVYKNFFNQKKHVLEYRCDDIRQYFKLSREDMVRLALLVGSDYTTGLPGIGPVTALEVLAAFPSPQNPPSADQVLAGLCKFQQWVNSGFLVGPTRATLKNKVKNTTLIPGFPSKAVVEAYLYPEVDKSDERFSWSKPNLQLLEKYAKIKFGWSTERCNELLLPVMKKLLEATEQPTIDRFFRVLPSETLVEGRLSKRVQGALKSLGRSMEPNDNPDDPQPGTSHPKKRKTTRKTTVSLDPLTERLHQETRIPQRERDRKLMEEQKKKAAELLKSGRSKGRVRGKGRIVLKAAPHQAKVNLSESSSDSN